MAKSPNMNSRRSHFTTATRLSSRSPLIYGGKLLLQCQQCRKSGELKHKHHNTCNTRCSSPRKYLSRKGDTSFVDGQSHFEYNYKRPSRWQATRGRKWKRDRWKSQTKSTNKTPHENMVN